MVTRTDTRLEQFRAQYLPKLVAAFHFTLVLAFESRAGGEGLTDSDLDLLIISGAFRDVRWLDRPVQVWEALDLPFGADLLCYTTEECERKRQELGIVRTASEEGIVLLKKGAGHAF